MSDFWKQPQSIWWRKALFQIHLWAGLGVGLYIIVIGLTGSALVLREEVRQTLTRPQIIPANGRPRLDLNQIEAVARRANPGLEVSWLWNRDHTAEATEVWFDQGSRHIMVAVDPYSGAYLGLSRSGFDGVLEWLADLHINLLAGRPGLTVNGVGAILLTLLCATGIVIWWPGYRRWKEAIAVRWSAGWKRINFDLHSAVGIWTVLFVSIWGVTGAYFAFPAPFRAAVNAVAPLSPNAARERPPRPQKGRQFLDTNSLVLAAEAAAPGKITTWVHPPNSEQAFALVYRMHAAAKDSPITFVQVDGYDGKVLGLRAPAAMTAGDRILRWFGYLHFGDFGGTGVKVLWTLLGLALPALTITGYVMYWNRYLGKRWAAVRQGKVESALSSSAA